MMEEIKNYDKWLEPPCPPLHCRCEGVCEYCKRPKCNHGEYDEQCECVFCEGCGQVLDNYDPEYGDAVCWACEQREDNKPEEV